MFELDIYGNLYYTIDSVVYQFNVSNKGELVLESGDYTIFGIYDNEMGTIHSYDSSLKKETTEQILLMDEDDPFKQELYYPEDNHYNEIVDIQYEENGFSGLEAYELTNDKFYFSNDGNFKINIYKRNNGDTESLYDTLFFDEDKLMFKSTYSGNSLYRINIYETHILLKSIGNPTKKYELTIESLKNLIS
jgi:hypothetical protein